MTAHKHPAASAPASDCSPVSGAGANPIGAGPGASRHLLSPTGEAGAPNLSNLSKPWGNDTICPGCNRGKTYSCICDPFFEDEDTPEPRFDPEGGWAFAERMALGMVKP